MSHPLIAFTMAFYTGLALFCGIDYWWAIGVWGLLVGGSFSALLLSTIRNPLATAALVFLALLGFRVALMAQFTNPESMLCLFWLSPQALQGLGLVAYGLVLGLTGLTVLAHRNCPDPLLSPPLLLTAWLVLTDGVFFVIYPHPVGALRLRVHTACALAETAAVTWLVLAAGHLALERNATRRRIQSQKLRS